MSETYCDEICRYAGLSPWCEGRGAGDDPICGSCRQARGEKSDEEFMRHISLWELLQALVPRRPSMNRTRFYRPTRLA